MAELSTKDLLALRAHYDLYQTLPSEAMEELFAIATAQAAAPVEVAEAVAPPKRAKKGTE